MVRVAVYGRYSSDNQHEASIEDQVRVGPVVEGEIRDLHVGLRGTMSALYLKDLAQKIHRGVEGVVRAGRSGGGLSFG